MAYLAAIDTVQNTNKGLSLLLQSCQLRVEADHVGKEVRVEELDRAQDVQ